MTSKSVSASPNVRIGTTREPPESEYAHLSEKERMMQGYPYKPFVDELVKVCQTSHLKEYIFKLQSNFQKKMSIGTGPCSST